MSKTIKDKTFPYERDLYGVNDIILINCKFDGVEDGESALKEASNVNLIDCYMNLRYPLWHDNNVKLDNVTMTTNCRASLWYSNNISISNSKMLGIKPIRECSDIQIEKCIIDSVEFGWKSNNITIKDSNVISEYFLFLSKDIKVNKLVFRGKYSFQYVENVVIEDSILDTKDAFWHAKNVIVKNSVVKGEYLAWYSENITFINCEIIGTQPLCYCKNLKLIDCKMIDTDFSFEYSSVNAKIIGNIKSVKNPSEGQIIADSIEEIILTDDSKYPCNCKIITNK